MKIFIRYFLACFLVLSVAACSSTPKKRSFGEVMDDGVITNKLKMKYMKDKIVKAHQIDIDTWKGVVSLKGSVDSQSQINRAIEFAERQQGVRQVKSYLVIEGEKPWTTKPKKPKTPYSQGGKSMIEEKDITPTGSGKERMIHADEENSKNGR